MNVGLMINFTGQLVIPGEKCMYGDRREDDEGKLNHVFS